MHVLRLSWILIVMSGCQTVYYNFWEALGHEKRDLLRSNIELAQLEQEQTRKDLKDALDRLRKEYDVSGGDLEKSYDQLSSDYDNAVKQSKKIRARKEKIEEIAADLFQEWETEANSMNNASYRQESLSHLTDAKIKFASMQKHMSKVIKTLDPVLIKMRDQTLYLKHNLNAQAITVFKREIAAMENDIHKLIQTINDSIKASEVLAGDFK